MSQLKNEETGTGQHTFDACAYLLDRCEIAVRQWPGDKSRVELVKVFRGGGKEVKEFELCRNERLVLNYDVDTEQMVGHEVQHRVENRVMWVFL